MFGGAVICGKRTFRPGVDTIDMGVLAAYKRGGMTERTDWDEAEDDIQEPSCVVGNHLFFLHFGWNWLRWGVRGDEE